MNSITAPRRTPALRLAAQELSGSTSSNLERQMQNEEENVLREWDTSIKRRTEGSLRIRSGSMENNSVPRPRVKKLSTVSAPSTSDLLTTGRIHFDDPELDVTSRQDTSFGSQFEHLDGDSRKFQYVDCPNSGGRLFRIELDVTGFTDKDIQIKMSGGRLTIHGVRQENMDGKKSTNEFCRKIKLPDDVASDKIRCVFANEKLIIEVPVRLSASSNPESLNATSVGSNEGKIPSNCPTVLSGGNGRQLFLYVDVGRVFKANDVTVKVRSERKISITAEINETTSYSRTYAKLERDFDLPARIDRHSLDAGFMDNGVLKITASVIESEDADSDAPSSTKLVKVEITENGSV